MCVCVCVYAKKKDSKKEYLSNLFFFWIYVRIFLKSGYVGLYSEKDGQRWWNHLSYVCVCVSSFPWISEKEWDRRTERTGQMSSPWAQLSAGYFAWSGFEDSSEALFNSFRHSTETILPLTRNYDEERRRSKRIGFIINYRIFPR